MVTLRQGRTGRTVVGVGALVLLLGAGALVGCSGADDASTSKGRFNTVGSAIDASGAGSSGADASGGASATKVLTSGEPAGTQVADDRDVIYTGSLTVRVTDAERAGRQANDLAADVGGYLARSDAALDEDQEVRVTLRFPADAFDEVMTRVAKLGSVQGRKVDSEDVTDQVVDLQGRLDNAQTSAKRLRELLAKAEQIQNVIAIEDRLTQRETEIEGITGQLEVLKDQVKLATVRATFTERADPAVSNDLPGPLEAMKAGGVAVVNGLIVALAAAAFLLPFLPFALLAWWLIRRWRRAHPKVPPGWARGSFPPPPDPPASTPPPTPAGSAPLT